MSFSNMPQLCGKPVKEELLLNDSELANSFTGKTIDFQFTVQPKAEGIDVKEETIEGEFVGEAIDFFINGFFEESQGRPKTKPNELYKCNQCSIDSTYKNHNLHEDFKRITTKPLNASNPYVCNECNFSFIKSNAALFHLSLHDKTSFRCIKCDHVAEKLSDLIQHLKTVHSKDRVYICPYCNFVTTGIKFFYHHRNRYHEVQTVYKCPLCEDFWPDKDHTLHEKMSHIKRKYLSEKQPYVCKTCNIELVEPDEIYDHLNIHGDIGIFCNFCSLTCNTIEDLEEHKRISHQEEINKQKDILKLHNTDSKNDVNCYQCDRFWPDANHVTHESMIKIEKNVTKDDPYRCNKCGVVTHDLREVYNHVNSYCLKKYKCPFCPMHFSRTSYRDSHVVSGHPEEEPGVPVFRCNFCEYRTVKLCTLKTHLATHKSKEEKIPAHKCAECNYRALTSAQIKVHRLKKHPTDSDKLYSCKHCIYTTYFPAAFKKHMITHSSEMIKCDICPFLGRDKQALYRHRRLHFKTDKSSNSDYVCETCAKRFKYKYNFNQHLINAHQEEGMYPSKSYTCFTCQHTTTNRASFIVHTRIHFKKVGVHSGLLYCANCEYKTLNKGNLIQHMVKHADPSKLQLYKCTICSFATKRPHNLRNHIKFTHKYK